MVGIKEVEKIQVKGTEEKFPILRKRYLLRCQMHQKKPHLQIEPDKNSLSLNSHIPNIQNNERIWKATREESKVTYKSRLFKIMAQFSVETLKASETQTSFEILQMSAQIVALSTELSTVTKEKIKVDLIYKHHVLSTYTCT